MKPGKHLPKKALEILIQSMRLWPKNYRDQIAPLVLHARWLQATVDELEKEVRALRQPTMFEMPKKNTWEPSPIPEPRGTKWERLKMCVEGGLWEKPGMSAMLLRLGISKEKAQELYLKWKETGIVPEI